MTASMRIRPKNATRKTSTNAAAIQSAIVSEASNEYVAKVNTYAANVDSAHELLSNRIQKLATEIENARATEAKAQSIAEGVTTFSMQ